MENTGLLDFKRHCALEVFRVFKYTWNGISRINTKDLINTKIHFNMHRTTIEEWTKAIIYVTIMIFLAIINK